MEDFFHLSWNNHKATLLNNICDLRQRELFCDATITCHGKYFAVHKLVLSSFSGYFKEIFEKTPCKHPFIIIKDVLPEDLEILLEFMYKGRVELSRHKLSSLMKIASDLKIKGLSFSEEKEDQYVHNSSNISMPQPVVIGEEFPNDKFLSSFSLPKFGNSFESQQIYSGPHSTPVRFKSEQDLMILNDSILEINPEPLLSSREVFLNAESVPDPLSTSSPLKKLPEENSKPSSSNEIPCNSDGQMKPIKEDQSNELELNIECNSLDGYSDNETSSNVNSLFSEDSTATKSDNGEGESMEATLNSQSNESFSMTDTLKTWADILRLKESQKLAKHINKKKKKANALRKHIHKKTLRSKTLNSPADKNKENRQEPLKVKDESLNLCSITENSNTPSSSSTSAPKKSDNKNEKMIADYLNHHDIISGNASENGAPSWARSGEENALLLELAKRREDACKVLVKKLSDDVFGGMLPSAYMAKYNSLTQQLNSASSYPLSQQMVPNSENKLVDVKVAIERLQDSDNYRSGTLGAASASTSEWLLNSPVKKEHGESSIFASIPQASADKEKEINAFKCDYCIFRTSKKSSMVNHLKKHQKNRFKCKYCSYETSHANLLLTHGKIHSGERPYLCEYCPYRAAQRTSLVNHTRTHTGEKPFKCEYCDYRATQKSNLNYHLRLHNNTLNKSF